MKDFQIKGFKAFLYYLGIIDVILSPILWIVFLIMYYGFKRKPVKKGYAINSYQKMFYVVGIISLVTIGIVLLFTVLGILLGLSRALF